jgi:hypothetical protein
LHVFTGLVDGRRITGTVVADHVQIPVEITRP